jgi:putative salt-induced outer membrane protein YdiY
MTLKLISFDFNITASILFILLLTVTIPRIYAQTDSLILKNGNVIVGEIKSMDRGVVQIETDYSDSDFKIEWDQVAEFYSPRIYLITLSDGSRANEPINSNPDNPQQIVIGGEGSDRTVGIMDLVYINPLDQTFISRLSAAVSIGYNFTKANNLNQLSSRISLGYLADFWALNGSLDIVKSSQEDADDINRTDGLITFRYFLKKDWFIVGKADFLSNDEQKLKLRSAFSAGLGKFLVHTNQVHLGISGGGVWNNETFTDETIDDRDTREAFIGGQLDVFDIGDLNLFTGITVFPNLSESGRVRSDFKFDLKYDLPLDFFINVGFTLNYDNQPVEGAEESDYVLQTTFGWDL